MTESDATLEGCEPQLLSQHPNGQWTIDQLSQYAIAQNKAIDQAENALTPCYWRLGQALELARKQFGSGQWTKFLEEFGINKTRASKARAIRRTFTSEQKTAHLTVRDAYEQRERKKHKKVTKGAKPTIVSVPGMLEFFIDVCKQANVYRDEAPYASHEQAQAYLGAVDETLAELQQLRVALCLRAEAA